MIQRYSRPAMREIWSEQRKLEIWLQIELLASEALCAQGLVPEKDFAQMKAKAAFSVKMALMYDEFGRALRRMESVKDSVAVGKLSGAVGTSAHLSPDVETFVCEKLGLRPAPIATQVIQRDLHAEFIGALALIGAS